MLGFRKKKEVAALPANRAPGFLMTDFERKNGRKPTMDDLVKVAMLVPLPKPVTIDQNGMVVAMDSATGQDSTIQEIKLLNSGSRGISPPLPQLEWYAAQTFIGYQICAIISQQWLVNKALLMPAEDATRNGYVLTTNDGKKLDPEITDFIRERDEDFKTDLHLVDQLYSGRLFGIRVAMYQVDSPDKDYYEKPFNPDGVRPGSYRGIVQIDPYWIMPLLDMPSAANPASKHFYEPTWWMINGKKVHRSHLCVMRNGGTLPDILKPTYFYGGLPIPQLIAERVFASERTANEAPMLALSKRMTIYKADLTEAAGNPNALEQKISKWSEFMNNFGIKLIGGDEEVTQHDLSLADLDAVIMTQYQLVAACASTPATELLGTSPKGFNSTGEYEAKSYTKFLKTCQKHHLTPLLRGHYQRLVRSEVLPRFKKIPYFTVLWNSTDSPTAKEQAEVNLAKAQTDAALVQAGAIDGYDVRQRLISDPESGYSGIPDIVQGGPGDREAEQERQEEAVNMKPDNADKGGDE